MNFWWHTMALDVHPLNIFEKPCHLIWVSGLVSVGSIIPLDVGVQYEEGYLHQHYSRWVLGPPHNLISNYHLEIRMGKFMASWIGHMIPPQHEVYKKKSWNILFSVCLLVIWGMTWLSPGWNYSGMASGLMSLSLFLYGRMIGWGGTWGLGGRARSASLTAAIQMLPQRYLVLSFFDVCGGVCCVIVEDGVDLLSFCVCVLKCKDSDRGCWCCLVCLALEKMAS